MPSNPYAAQLDVSILTAEPIELVRILYRTALGSVSAARAHLAAGEIKERSQAINKALSVLHELALSLNPEVEPTLASTISVAPLGSSRASVAPMRSMSAEACLSDVPGASCT